MEVELADRVAIVTGATAGIGRGIATGLASNGARVAVVARRRDHVDATVDELQRIRGDDEALGITADVSASDDTERIVSETVARWGTVDILVNNAGQPAHVPFHESDDATWQYDIDLKLLAAVRLARLVLPLMRSRGGGRIVNILSIGAKLHRAASAPTSVTRAAGLALTKVLANEFAVDGVRVNAILLGVVKSDQWVRQWEANGRPGTLEDFYADMGRQVPLGRVGDPADVASLVTFLVSRRADYITGASINCDGGLSPVV